MTFNKDMAIMLDWFVVECGSDEPSAVLIKGVQNVADQYHSYLCACAGPRWIDCTEAILKNHIERLFDKDNWRLTQTDEPLAFHEKFEQGYISITRITEPLPNETFHINRLDPRPALHFIVPLLPPSVNHYKLPNAKKGSYRISKDAKAFMDAVPVFARPTAPENWPWDINPKVAGIRPFYEVDLVFHIHGPSFLKRDSDNLEKVAFDALTACGAITDDRYIKYHTNRAVPVAEKIDERTEYTVRIVEDRRK